MDYLSAEQILSAADVVYEDVHTPEWGGWTRVRGLSAMEKDQFDQSVSIQQGPGKVKVNMMNARAKMAALCIVDAEGKRIFTDQQAVALGEKSSQAMQRVWAVATRLAGMDEDAVEEAKDDLEQGPRVGPSSDSRPSSIDQLASS